MVPVLNNSPKGLVFIGPFKNNGCQQSQLESQFLKIPTAGNSSVNPTPLGKGRHHVRPNGIHERAPRDIGIDSQTFAINAVGLLQDSHWSIVCRVRRRLGQDHSEQQNARRRQTKTFALGSDEAQLV